MMMMMVVGAAVVGATGHRSSMGIVDWLAAVPAHCPPATSHQPPQAQQQLLLLIALTRGDTDTAVRSHYMWQESYFY